MHRSPSKQLRTPEFPRYAVASSLCCLALSFTFWSNSAENEHLLLGKSWREDGEKVPHLLQGSARDGNPAVLDQLCASRHPGRRDRWEWGAEIICRLICSASGFLKICSAMPRFSASVRLRASLRFLEAAVVSPAMSERSPHIFARLFSARALNISCYS
jgi:hypothetical protein